MPPRRPPSSPPLLDPFPPLRSTRSTTHGQGREGAGTYAAVLASASGRSERNENTSEGLRVMSAGGGQGDGSGSRGAGAEEGGRMDLDSLSDAYDLFAEEGVMREEYISPFTILPEGLQRPTLSPPGSYHPSRPLQPPDSGAEMGGEAADSSSLPFSFDPDDPDSRYRPTASEDIESTSAIRASAGLPRFGAEDVDRLEGLDEINPYLPLPIELGSNLGISDERSTSAGARAGSARASTGREEGSTPEGMRQGRPVRSGRGAAGSHLIEHLDSSSFSPAHASASSSSPTYVDHRGADNDNHNVLTDRPMAPLFTLNELLGLPRSSSSTSFASSMGLSAGRSTFSATTAGEPSLPPGSDISRRPTRAQISARLASELQSRSRPSSAPTPISAPSRAADLETNPRGLSPAAETARSRARIDARRAAAAAAGVNARASEPAPGSGAPGELETDAGGGMTWEGGISAARRGGYGAAPAVNDDGRPTSTSSAPAAPSSRAQIPVLTAAVRAGSNPVSVRAPALEPPTTQAVVLPHLQPSDRLITTRSHFPILSSAVISPGAASGPSVGVSPSGPVQSASSPPPPPPVASGPTSTRRQEAMATAILRRRSQQPPSSSRQSSRSAPQSVPVPALAAPHDEPPPSETYRLARSTIRSPLDMWTEPPDVPEPWLEPEDAGLMEVYDRATGTVHTITRYDQPPLVSRFAESDPVAATGEADDSGDSVVYGIEAARSDGQARRRGSNAVASRMQRAGGGGTLARQREEREVDLDLRLSSSVDSEESGEEERGDFWASTSSRADHDAALPAREAIQTRSENRGPSQGGQARRQTFRAQALENLQRRALRSEVDLLAPEEGTTVVRGLFGNPALTVSPSVVSSAPAPAHAPTAASVRPSTGGADPSVDSSLERRPSELRRGANNRRRQSIRFTGEPVDFGLGVEGVRRAGPGSQEAAASVSALPPWRREQVDSRSTVDDGSVDGGFESGMEPTNGTGEPRDPPLVVRSVTARSRGNTSAGMRRRRSSSGSTTRFERGGATHEAQEEADVKPRIKRPRQNVTGDRADEAKQGHEHKDIRPSYLQYTTLPSSARIPSSFTIPSFLSRLALTKYHPLSAKQDPSSPLLSTVPPPLSSRSNPSGSGTENVSSASSSRTPTGPSWPLITFTEYPPPTQNDSDAAALRTTQHIPRGLSVHYYEAKVLSSGPEAYMSVGWMQGHCSTQRLVGWDKGSWGWHADDARTFEGRGTGDMFHKWGVGDTIGCGIDFTINRAFFTRNGKFLDHRFRNITPSPPLYPAVALRNVRESLAINLLGPFEFDIDSYVRRVRDRICLEAIGPDRVIGRIPRLVDQLPAPAAPTKSAETGSQVDPDPAPIPGAIKGDPGQKGAAAFVIDYLSHHGHLTSLQALKRDMSKRGWMPVPTDSAPSALIKQRSLSLLREQLGDITQPFPEDLISQFIGDPSSDMRPTKQHNVRIRRNVPGWGCMMNQLDIQRFIHLVRRAEVSRRDGALAEADELDAEVLNMGRSMLQASSCWDLADARSLSAAFGLVSLPLGQWPMDDPSHPCSRAYRSALAATLVAQLRAGEGLKGVSHLEVAVTQTKAVWQRLKEKGDGQVGLVDLKKVLKGES